MKAWPTGEVIDVITATLHRHKITLPQALLALEGLADAARLGACRHEWHGQTAPEAPCPWCDEEPTITWDTLEWLERDGAEQLNIAATLGINGMSMDRPLRAIGCLLRAQARGETPPVRLDDTMGALTHLRSEVQYEEHNR